MGYLMYGSLHVVDGESCKMRQRIAELESTILSAKSACGDFINQPFDGSLSTAISAISMRCGSSEKRIAELEAEIGKVKHENKILRGECIKVVDSSKQSEVLDDFVANEKKISTLKSLVGTAWNDGLCTGFERGLSHYNAIKREQFLRANGLGEG
jgi:hypothetical protein